MAKSTRTDDHPATPRRLAEILRVREGFDLGAVESSGTPGFPAGRIEGETALALGSAQLSELQERLFAAGFSGSSPGRVLLIIQGMDTSGKGGIVRHVVGAVDPQGVRHAAFKAPTPEELAHDFLWRVRPQVPGPGLIGVFDRSHYEDVLIVRVHDLAPGAEVERRYGAITEFENELAGQGAAIVKVMLHISPAEQLRRLEKRLNRPDKYWKYSTADLDEHAFWDSYQEAYQAALVRCSTDEAPWYVIPADRKWYARWAVQQLLIDALTKLDPQWPEAKFDVEAERARLAALQAEPSS